MSADDLYASINTSQKFFTQAWTATLVPRIGLKNIPLNLCREVQFNAHIDCELAAELLPRKAMTPDC